MKTEPNSNADNTDSQTRNPDFTPLFSDSESRRDSDAAFEMARLLDLAAAQIDLTMRESDPAVAVLTDVFSHITERSESLAASARRIQDGTASLERDRLLAICGELSADTQSAVVALQFYDRLTQRLRHVSDNLEMLAALARDKNRLDSLAAWEKLKRAVRKGYSGETEKALFDAVMNGATTADALQQVSNPGQAEWPDAVEMF